MATRTVTVALVLQPSELSVPMYRTLTATVALVLPASSLETVIRFRPRIIAPDDNAYMLLQPIALLTLHPVATRIEYFINGQAIDTNFSAFNALWYPQAQGSYVLMARAIYPDSTYTDSNIFNIYIYEYPICVLLTPPGGWVGTVGAAIRIGASSSYSLGVAQVEFFADGVSFGIDTVYPYSSVYLPTSIGVKTIQAVLTAIGGAITNSNSQDLTITQPSAYSGSGGWNREPHA